jgi:hypothetical protein
MAVSESQRLLIPQFTPEPATGSKTPIVTKSPRKISSLITPRDRGFWELLITVPFELWRPMDPARIKRHNDNGRSGDAFLNDDSKNYDIRAQRAVSHIFMFYRSTTDQALEEEIGDYTLVGHLICDLLSSDRIRVNQR